MALTVCSLFLGSPGKGKGKRQKKQQLWAVTCALLHTHTHTHKVWEGVGGVCAVCCCCCGGAAVATFYCFCCIAKRITARCGKSQHRGWGAGGNGGLGAALFEEFMAFRDVSMYVPSERAMERLDTIDPATAAAFPTAKIGNLPQASSSSQQQQSVDCHSREIYSSLTQCDNGFK